MYRIDTTALKTLAQQALDGKPIEHSDMLRYDFAIKVAIIERLEEIADQLDKITGEGIISVECREYNP